MIRSIVLPLLALALPASAQLDTIQVLTRKALVQLVTDNHPAVRQALLRNEMGEATVRSARGAFDPKAVAGYSEKTFEGKDYYSLLDAGLKVPTWFGAELFGGFQNNSGIYVNDADITPDAGLLKAGVSVSVGQGLFIDKRRADLRKAQAFQDMAEAERLRLLNDIYYTVLSDHLEWIASFQRLGIARSAVEQANIRLTGIRGSFRGGDRPAIDTLEALLQVQDRIMRLRDAEVDYRNASLMLSNHLWDDVLRPLEIGPSVVPDTTDLRAPDGLIDLNTLTEQAMQEHPKLLELQGKLEQLEVERRLRSEFLKPQLDLSYSLLANGGLVNNEAGVTYDAADRMLGVGFSMPLFLRKERGELTLATLRRTEAELGIDRERQQIRTTIGRSNNDVALLDQQVSLSRDMVTNYGTLLNGENRRFQAGESSLFLVNQREVALLDNQLKLVDLIAKLRKAHFALDKEAGILWRTITAASQP
ncbi:MAG: TolC family protein [Flavobacteriales bacterium]|jgi:outer membrane protein TolC|nr:TolC family protein [Flavobacteriales bacterium]